MPPVSKRNPLLDGPVDSTGQLTPNPNSRLASALVAGVPVSFMWGLVLCLWTLVVLGTAMPATPGPF
jgi:hypothetical protein